MPDVALIQEGVQWSLQSLRLFWWRPSDRFDASFTLQLYMHFGIGCWKPLRSKTWAPLSPKTCVRQEEKRNLQTPMTYIDIQTHFAQENLTVHWQETILFVLFCSPVVILPPSNLYIYTFQIISVFYNMLPFYDMFYPHRFFGLTYAGCGLYASRRPGRCSLRLCRAL